MNERRGPQSVQPMPTVTHLRTCPGHRHQSRRSVAGDGREAMRHKRREELFRDLCTEPRSPAAVGSGSPIHAQRPGPNVDGEGRWRDTVGRGNRFRPLPTILLLSTGIPLCDGRSLLRSMLLYRLWRKGSLLRKPAFVARTTDCEMPVVRQAECDRHSQHVFAMSGH